MIALRGLVFTVFIAGVLCGALAWGFKTGVLGFTSWWARAGLVVSLALPLGWGKLRQSLARFVSDGCLADSFKAMAIALLASIFLVLAGILAAIVYSMLYA